MHPLRTLFHELIDHSIPAGNKRGELHALVDDAVPDEHPGETPGDVSRETGPESPETPEPTEPPKAVFQPPKTAKSDGAAAS